jgi:hypothetical protein
VLVRTKELFSRILKAIILLDVINEKYKLKKLWCINGINIASSLTNSFFLRLTGFLIRI